MQTYKERLEKGLEILGYTRDLSDRSKYAAWQPPARLGADYRLFVGPNGALRKGRCASQSYSIGDVSHQTGAYRELLAKADAAAKPSAEEFEV